MRTMYKIGEVVEVNTRRNLQYYHYGVVLETMTNGSYVGLYTTLSEAIDSDCHLHRIIIVESELKSTGHFNNLTVLEAL